MLMPLTVNKTVQVYTMTSLTFVTTQQTESQLSYAFAAPKVHDLQNLLNPPNSRKGLCC